MEGQNRRDFLKATVVLALTGSIPVSRPIYGIPPLQAAMGTIYELGRLQDFLAMAAHMSCPGFPLPKSFYDELDKAESPSFG